MGSLPVSFDYWEELGVTAGLSGRHTSRAGASIQGTLSNWVTTLINNRIAERQKRIVSERAWNLYVNDAMAHGIIEGLIVEGIGTGLTPIQAPMTRWLKQTPEWQQEYQQRVADIFELWGLDSRNFADAQGRMNIYMLQALALFMWKLDGIGPFQVVMKESPYRPLSLSILPIDPGWLVTPTDLQAAENVYDGVELDDYGAPSAAYILKPTKYGMQYSSARLADCTRIPVINNVTGLPNLVSLMGTPFIFYICV